MANNNSDESIIQSHHLLSSVWPFSVFLIRNFIPFTLLWHLRFTIEFLWEILFFLIRHTYDSKKELWFGGAQMNMKVIMTEYYCYVDFFIWYAFIWFFIYLSYNLCLLSQKYVHNFAINLELVLHLSMSGRSNWIDALLHFCFVGHWAWQLFKKQFVYCFEISFAMPQTCSTYSIKQKDLKKLHLK